MELEKLKKNHQLYIHFMNKIKKSMDMLIRKSVKQIIYCQISKYILEQVFPFIK